MKSFMVAFGFVFAVFGYSALAEEQEADTDKDKPKNELELSINGPKHDIKPPPS